MGEARGEAITAAVSDRICKHMNDDHADSIVFYAEVYGQAKNVSAARLLKIDPEGMDILAQVEGSETPVRVSFEKPLANAKEAHVVLVEMLKRSRP